MSELNIFLLFAGEKNKCWYISIEQGVKNEMELCINYQAVHDKTNQVFKDCTGIQEKKRVFYLKRKGLSRLFNIGYVTGLSCPTDV